MIQIFTRSITKKILSVLFILGFAQAVIAQNTLDLAGLSSSAPAVSCYSLRKLSSAYVGAAINVRRSSDDMTMDIGFTAGGYLDTVALKTFVGSDNGLVTIWYDQSGNARDQTQTNNSQQPIIVNAGAIYRRNGQPTLYYDASGSGMYYTGGDYLNSLPLTVNTVAGSNSSNGNARRAIQGTNNWLIGPYGNNDGWYADGWNYYYGGLAWSQSKVENFTVVEPLSDPDIAWRDGALEPVNGNSKGVPNKIQTGTSGAYYEPLDGFISEVMAFNSVLSDVDRLAMEGNQKALFGIASSNSALSALTLDNGTLTPAFTTSTYNYTTIVDNAVTTVQVTPTASSPSSTIQAQVNGAGFVAVSNGAATSALPLNVGDNNLEVKITAEDGTDTSAYIINVRRAPLPPTVQAGNVTFTATGPELTTANWTNGDGATRAVFMYAGTAANAVPVDGTTYTDNSVFGSGDQIGSTGWYCIYKGTGTSVNITGLNGTTTYSVQVVEFNGSAGTERFLTTTVPGNPASVTTTDLNSFDKLGLTSSTNTTAGGYALRLLSSGYSGPLARITIGSNYYDVYPDASADKSFSLTSPISAAYINYNDALTGATANTLASIVSGSTNATVAIWYDQSANANDVTQPSTPNQPAIIAAGTILTEAGKPALQFSAAASNYFLSVNNVTIANGSTANAVAQNINTTNGYGAIVSQVLTSYNTVGFFLGRFNNVLTSAIYVPGWQQSNFNNNDVPTVPFIATGIYGNNNITLYVDRVAQNAAGANNRINSTNPLTIGRWDGGNYFDGYLPELTLFTSGLSDTERQAIEGSQYTYFGLGLPIAVTNAVTNVSVSGAQLSGNITSDFGNPVTDKGIVYGLAANPTLADSVLSNGTGIGTISVTTPVLTPFTLYHFRAYATNSVGTVYGADQTFTSLSAPNVLDKLGLTNTTLSASDYSMRLLSSTYAGPLVRITIGSNYYDVFPDATPNKTFSLASPISAVYSNYNDVATGATSNTLGSIVSGSTNATVAIWYDQTGNANDGVQANSSNQPAIISTGVIDTLNGKPALLFSTATQTYFQSLKNVTIAGASSANAVAQNIATPNYYADLISQAYSGGAIGFALGKFNGNLSYDLYAPGWQLANYTGDFPTIPFIATGVYGGTTINLFVNKVQQTPASANANITSTDPVRIGIRWDGGGETFDGFMPEAIVFALELTSPQRQLIENNQAAYYGITTPSAPVVSTTTPATNIAAVTATLSGNVSSGGGNTLTDEGIVYASTANPTIGSGTQISAGTIAVGDFSSNVSGLAPNTTYHYVAYATNGIGTSYGADQTFTTGAIPTITSFSPLTAAVGATVTITGTNFNTTAANNIVFFGATKAIVTAATATSLTVTVPIGATYAPITELNTGTALATYSQANFSLTFTPHKTSFSNADFAPQVTFATNGQPYTAVLSDIDGDGKPDMVVTNQQGGNVSVFLNNGTPGNPSFAAKVDFVAGSSPAMAAVADLDGDGKPDMVVVNQNSATISVFLNTSTVGNVSFATQVTYPTTGACIGMAIGDLDGDGKPDLAVVGKDANVASVYLNTSTIGAINFATRLDVGTGTTPISIAIGDIDGDGKPDLVTANSNASTVSVIRNTSAVGALSFAAKADFTVGSGPAAVALGDLDGDGKLDIATADGGDAASMLLNTSTTGNISFATKVDVTVPAGYQPWYIAIGDIDGDGKPDLALANNGSPTLSLFHNNSTVGNLAFGTYVNLAAGNNPQYVIIGDVDGDGKPDVVTANNHSNTIGVFRNTPLFAPTIQASSVLFTSTTATTITASWTIGNGASRAVFIKAASTGSPVPVDLTAYTANTTFASGTQIGVTGWYCVYNGTGTTVNIDGLTAATTYQVMAVEYNGTGSNVAYLTATATGDPAGVTTLGPVISTTGSLSALSTTYGTASTSGTFNVSGANMTAGILITPPTGFEVSTDNSTFTSTVTVGATGTIASSPVYIRLKSSAIVGTYSGNVVLSSTGATNVNVATVSSTVSGAPITITANNVNKTYGTAITGAAGSTAYTISSGALKNGNTISSVTIAYGTGAAATDAATTYTGQVTPSVVVGANGFVTGNYVITYAAGDIVVGKIALTVTATGPSKTYGTALTAATSASNFTVTGTPASGEALTSVTLTPNAAGLSSTTAAGASYVVTPSVATGTGGFVASNYNITYTPFSGTVTAISLTVTATGPSKTYGTALTAATSTTNFTVTGTPASGEALTSIALTPDAAGLSAATTAGSSYVVTPSAATGTGGFLASNYNITYTPFSGTVTAISLTVTATGPSKTYGTALTAGTSTTNFTVTGTVAGGQALTSVTLSPDAAGLSATTAAGASYVITPSAATGTGGFLASNYNITYTAFTGTVAKASLTITAATATKTYGQALTTGSGFASGFTSSGLKNSESIGTVTLTYGTGALATANVGIYPSQVTPSAATGGTFTASNYNIAYNTGSISVSTATLTIDANGVSKVPGTTLTGGSGSTAFVATGLKNGETAGTVTITYGAGANAADAPGTYVNQVQASALTGGTITTSNYTITYNNGDIVIGTSTITVNVAGGALQPLSTSFGTASGTTTFTVSGSNLANDITITPPTGFEVASTSSGPFGSTVTLNESGGGVGTTNIYVRLAAITAVGSYSGNVVASSPGATNQNVATQSSTVNAYALTVKANNATKTYGTAIAGGVGSTAYTITSGTLQNSNTIGSVTIAYGTGAAATAGVNTYTGSVTPSAAAGANGFLSSNYNITYATGNIIVSPIALTITADNQTKAYGAALPTLTASYSGFVNGDTNASLTTQPTITTTATASSGVAGSPYSITASGAANSNYTISYVAGTLTITKAALTITADNQTKAYGAALPTLTASYTGFVNGDTNASMTTQPSLSTTATASSSVAGSPYSITASGAVNSNYTISYVAGTLTITKAALTITADNQTKAYGAALPTLTASYTGFVNGDTNASLTTQPSLSTTATASSSVAGSPYSITASGAVNSNYTISYVAGTLTITKAALTITADNQTKAYGAALPTLTASYTGFVNGDTNASLTTQPSLSTTATASSGVAGSPYSITASGAANSNYTISYVAGTLAITKAALTITADNQTKAYGAALPTLTASYTGFVNGDTNASMTTQPSLSTTATASSGVAGSPYSITASGAVNSNYTISYVAGTLTITKAALTITADNQTKVYGAALPTLTASYSGFVNGDTNANLTTQPTITTTATASSGVAGSPYSITASGAANSNYTISYVAGTLTITKAALTITADNQTKAYGAALPTLTASYSGFVNGDTNASLTTQPTITTTATASSGVAGSPYSITASGAVNSNYTISYVAGTLTITKAALTITADNQTKVYGAALPTLTASYTGFVNGDTNASLTTQPTITTTATASSGVAGSPYSITASGAVNSNYTISYVAGTLTITKAALTITADNQTKVYGAALPTLTASYTGFVNGDTNASLTTQPTITTTATASSGVAGSPYSITASGAVNSNYTISYVAGTLTITKAALTITADNQTKVYGAALPTLTASYSGFVNGDTNASLTTQPTITTTATASSGVAGSPYSITASGAVNSNYTISYVAGTLTITKAALTITADNQTKAYGAALPTLTASYSGFVNGDTNASLTTQPTITTTATASSGVAGSPYSITASGAVNSNYTISYVAGTLTITKTALTITANNQTKAYGTTNPALIVTYSGFVNGDTNASLTTQPTVTTTAVTGSAVNNYPITASGAANSNYTISYVAGTLTITKAALTITADNQTKVYGAALPTLTASYTGFVNGDTNASLTTQPTITTTATASSGVAGSPYSITASGAANSNYTISYVAGTLTITKAALTITANNQTKVYGTTNPALTVTYSGFVNGDTNASLTTQPTVTTTAVTGSAVNNYPITASGAANSNYTISYVAGTLTITKATLTITADNQTKVYGAALPTLTASYSGFVNGDTNASLTTQPTVTTTAVTGSAVNNYPITASGAANSNYTISYTAGILTVTQATLNIAANNQTKVYGTANPALTVTYSGFVNGDTNASLTTQPTVTTTAVTGSAVNNYPITASGAANSNYTISYTAGILTVTQATLNIAANNQTKVYGTANPALTVTYTGFVNGDTNTSLITQPAIITAAIAGSPVGTYPVTANGATSGNYSISYTAATLTVTPAALTITANNQSRNYGTTNPVLTLSYTGFVNADTNTNLTTQATVSTTATTASLPNTYPITVNSATDANYNISYVAGTLTVTPLTNANLGNLTTSAGTLSPVFAQATTAYTVSVANAVTTINITPTVADATATIKVNSVTVISGNASANVALIVGANIITTVVTAQDGITKISYTVTVNRAPSSNAIVANLAISNGTLTPIFNPSTYIYTVAVDNNIDTFTLAPTLADATATILINGVPCGNGNQSNAIALTVGDNIISVFTTAQDGITNLTYTITIHRATAPDAIKVSNILSPNGDGKNDTWVIKDILAYPNNTVTVYDRGGRIVYTKHIYTNDWGGTFKGAPLAEGTYYYVIDCGDVAYHTIKGFITIVRSR